MLCSFVTYQSLYFGLTGRRNAVQDLTFVGQQSNRLLVSNAQVYFMERAKAAGVKEQKEEEEEKLQPRWFESLLISQFGDRKIVRSFDVLFDFCDKRAVGSGGKWKI